MFGKKDKQESAEKPEKAKPEKPAKAEKPAKVKPEKAPKAPKVKAEKAAKPKKSKATSAKGGPNFLVAHVEKVVLGLVLAIAGYIVFAGINAKGYPSDRAPELLAKEAATVLTQISEDHWEAIAAERQVAHNFDELAKMARKPTDPSLYPVDVLDPKAGGPVEKRGDPKLLPPQQMVAKCFAGAIAIEVPTETADPFEGYEDADKVEGKKKKDKKRNAAGAGYGSDMADTGSMMGAPGNPIATIRRLAADYDLGVAVGAMAGGMGPGMMGMGSGSMTGSGPTGTKPRDGLGDPNKDRRPKTKIASQSTIFVAATALVPHKQMVEEYDRLFQNSGDYILMRDRPVYLSFEVQRVEVTKDPGREVKEEEWQTITDGIKQFALRKTWAIRPPLGRPVPEVADRNAVQPGLTMPIPPVLLRDYRDFCKHPAIDWAWNAKMLMAPRPINRTPTKEDEDVLPGEVGGAGNAMAGGMMGSGMMGSGDMYGGGSGMDMYGGGMDMYGGGSGDMYGSGSGDMYGGGMDMYGGGSGMDMYGGGSGMDMYGGGSGMMGGGMGGMPNAPQPEFKMLRFYDMLTFKDLGKTFRYRARLIMRDPNYPERDRRFPERDVVPAPAPNSLLPEVFARVAALRKKDDAAFKSDEKARRTMLNTDWSDPSQPVTIEGRIEVFAGLGFDPQPVPAAAAVDEGSANVVATIISDAFGTRFSKTFHKAARGAVLNSAKDETIEFIVPTTKVIKKATKRVATNAVIVDIRGGEQLAASNKREDPLATSGEVMVLLPDGTVQITNDIDDTFEYRMYTFADEHEQAEKGGAMGGGAMGSDAMYGSGTGT